MFLHTAYIQKKVYQLQNHHFSMSRFCVFWIPRHTLPGLISIKRNAIFGIHQASRTRFPNLISHRLSTIINRQWWFSRPSVEWLVFYWGVMKKGQFFLSQHDMKSLPCLRMSVLSHCCLFKKKTGRKWNKNSWRHDSHSIHINLEGGSIRKIWKHESNELLYVDVCWDFEANKNSRDLSFTCLQKPSIFTSSHSIAPNITSRTHEVRKVPNNVVSS